MKDSLIRSFNSFDSDILKQSSRQEWAPILHNLCYVHAALQLRARFGQSGWNNPKDFSKIGFTELMVCIMSEIYDRIIRICVCVYYYTNHLQTRMWI